MRYIYGQYRAAQRSQIHFGLRFDLRQGITETVFAFWLSSVSSADLLRHSPNTPGTYHWCVAVLSELSASFAPFVNSLDNV